MLSQIQEFLMELRDKYGFAIELDKLEYASVCADDITDLDEVYFRLMTIICTTEEQIKTYRAVFGERFLNIPRKQGSGQKKQPLLTDADVERLIMQAKQAKATESSRQDELQKIKDEVAKAQKALQDFKKTEMPSEEKMREVKANASPNMADPRIQKSLKEIADLNKKLLSASGNTAEARTKTADLENNIKGAISSHEYKDKLTAIFKHLMDAAKNNRANKELFGAILKLASAVNQLKELAPKTVSAQAKRDMQEVQTKIKTVQKSIPQYEEKEKELLRQQQKVSDQLRSAQQSAQKAADKAEDAKRQFEAQQGIEKDKVKDHSEIHRDIFKSNGGTVRTTNEIGELMKIDLKRMSLDERQQVMSYIRSNARIFKQQLKRKQNSHNHRQIDIRRTVKAAARTGGEPLVIKYKMPKKSHARVVVVADISGSCSSTASLALYFANTMAEAFPGGCRLFAFVRDLNPVNKYFDQKGPDEGIEEIYKHIPTRGVYSDYGTTIHQLREEYGGSIHSDTTIIFLGDARTNRRYPYAEDLKYLADRCKKVFWLNPEPKREWNTGDSVMGQYISAGAQAYCVGNVGELLDFLMDAAS